MNDNYKYFIISSTFMTCVFYIIPFELYFNAREYWNWNTNIVITFIVTGLVINLILLTIMKLMLRIDNVFVKNLALVLFASGIYILLADIFSPLQTTLLDGTELRSSEPLYYTIIEGLLLFFIVFGIFKINWRLISSIGVIVSILLMTVSIIYLIVILSHPKENLTSYNRDKIAATPTGNVYHIVLDEMQTDAAKLFLKEHNQYNEFQGFILFENNVSNYLYTKASFPSYMTGSLFAGGNFEAWQESYKSEGLLRAGWDKGYNFTFFSPRRSWCTKFISNCITIDDIFEKYSGEENLQIKDFIQIWFARIMPNILSNEAFDIGKIIGEFTFDLIGSNVTNIPHSISEGKEPFTSMLMLNEVISSEKNRPPNGQYVYIHAILPHGPYVLDENGNYNLDFRHNGTIGYYNQVKYALNLIIRYLQKLKELGRYDNSTILIHADTGHGHRGFIKKNGSKLIASAAMEDKTHSAPIFNNKIKWSEKQLISRTMALLMIKPQNNKNSFQFSLKKSQLIDLYPSLIELLKLRKDETDGLSLFSSDFPMDRNASFFYYPPEDIKPKILKINISNQSNLQESNIIMEGYIEKYPTIEFPSEMISFNIGSINEDRLELKGFYQREKTPGKSLCWRWARGKKSTIILEGYRLRRHSSILIAFEVSPFLVNNNRQMILKTQVSRAEVKLKPGLKRYEVTLDFPEGENPQIDIFYENSASPANLDISPDSRDLSVLWSEIAFRIIDK